MSRIDEAMRKAGQQPPGAEGHPPAADADHPLPPEESFEAPWAMPTRDVRGPEPAAGDDGVATEYDRSLAVFRGFKPGLGERLVVGGEAKPTLVEQYRRLAATLHHAQMDRGTKTLLVTSAVASEGKTLTATNLALTLGESYRRQVLLVDADLRRPTVHEVFQVPNVSGLSDGLHAGADQKLSLIQISAHVTLLTAGRPDPDPMHVLTSDRMRQILQEAAARFDWVVIDTPPVGVLPDANLLAKMVDTVLLVIRAGQTPFEMVQRAIDTIGRDRIIGTVLNSTAPGDSVAPDYYHYYYVSPRGSSRTHN